MKCLMNLLQSKREILDDYGDLKNTLGFEQTTSKLCTPHFDLNRWYKQDLLNGWRCSKNHILNLWFKNDVEDDDNIILSWKNME